MVKNNQNLVLKNVFITKISKTFDFFGQKSKKKNHVFLGAFIWNHPYIKHIEIENKSKIFGVQKIS